MASIKRVEHYIHEYNKQLGKKENAAPLKERLAPLSMQEKLLVKSHSSLDTGINLLIATIIAFMSLFLVVSTSDLSKESMVFSAEMDIESARQSCMLDFDNIKAKEENCGHLSPLENREFANKLNDSFGEYIEHSIKAPVAKTIVITGSIYITFVLLNMFILSPRRALVDVLKSRGIL